MSTRIYHHEDCLKHDPGPNHPENAERLHSIMDALQHSANASDYDFRSAPLGTQAQVLLAHTAEHWEELQRRAPQTGRYSLDPDTHLSPGSLNAALRGVGAACAGIDALLNDETSAVFCLTRPPGHHATPDRAMGFCLFNHIAIAALYAQQRGITRIAIVDFDVHHGNGTQDILQGRSGLHYLSTHQSPHYPGTGSTAENRLGNISNYPLPAGTDDASYRKLFSEEVLPALAAGEPQLILVSAGFDAHLEDPLAGLGLTEATYEWIGEQLRQTAARYSQGRMLSVLEGGYNLGVLGKSVDAFLSG